MSTVCSYNHTKVNLIQLTVMFLLLFSSLPIYGEDAYPAICMTKTNLNVRSTSSTNGRILKTLPSGTKVQVQRITNNGWAEIEYSGRKAYCSAKYLVYCEPVRPTQSRNISNNKEQSGFLSNIRCGGIWGPVFQSLLYVSF